MEDTPNNRLKILFLPAWYPGSEDAVDGIFIREHARAASLYNNVIVLYIEKAPAASAPGRAGVTSDLLEGDIRTIRMSYRSSSLPGCLYPGYIISVYRGLNRLIKGGWTPDIIHAHVYSAGFSAILMKAIFKIPVVVSEHSSKFARHALSLADILKARLALNKANVVLPVSRYLLEAIKRYRMGRRFRIIPNAVNTRLFHPPPPGEESGGKRILFVGLLKPRKGIPELLAAIRILASRRRDFTLDIVGDGPCREEYERLTREMGIEKLVLFNGLKTKEEIARIMRSCSFLVQPSLIETFGVTCIEAMACGKPVVANRLPVFREKINDDRGVLVPGEDEGALAGAIDTMLDRYHNYSPEEISSFAGRNYSYAGVGRGLSDVYREVLRDVKNRRPR